MLDDFLWYCRKRRDYICLVYGLTAVVYGLWMMQYFVTFDAEGFYTAEYGAGWYNQWLILGRWFLVALKKAMGVSLINPFFSVTVFFVCFPLSAVLWGYLFTCWIQPEGKGVTDRIVDGKVIRGKVSKGQIVFDLLYLTHPVWAYQYAYRNQMEVISIVMVLLPVSILLTTRWIRYNQILPGILGMIGVVCCFGSYQAFVVVYISALMIFLFLQVLCDQVTHRGFWQQVLKICIVSILAYICYSKASDLICALMGLDRAGYSNYLLGQIRWGTDPLGENLQKCGAFLKMIFFGDSNTYSCIYGVEFIAGIVLLVLYNFRKTEFWKRIWLPILFIGIFLSAQFIDLLTVGEAVIRQEFAYVLTLAFVGALEWNILYRLLERGVSRVVAQAVCAVLLLVFSVNQIQFNTRLQYSDYRCMMLDYERMSELYYDALEDGAQPGSAIVFIGATSEPVEESVVEREIIGQTYFEVLVIAQEKAAHAMRAYGFDVTDPTEEQTEYAYSIADQLALYPSQDSIRIEEGLIIVRLQ